MIEEAFFGRSLRPEDQGRIRDRQHFAYPLYVIFLYAPTMLMNFPEALLVIWIAGLLMLYASVLLWFRIMNLAGRTQFFLLLSFFLSWPQTYIALQARQPILFVFFFISLGIYLIILRERPAAHVLAGVFMFLSTIKPQSSILAIAYLLGCWLPSLKDRHRVLHFLFGFLGAGIVSLIVTLWFVPGWTGEFLEALLRYRDYAGSTGAESLWGEGMVSVILGGSFAALAIWMSILSYKAGERDLHLIIFSYCLVLQGVIFPAHSYVAILGIPVAILAFQKSSRLLSERKISWFAVLSGAFLVMTYSLYKYWLAILSEAGFPEPISDFILEMMLMLPDIKFPALAVLGILLFGAWIRDYSLSSPLRILTLNAEKKPCQ